jgi:hypothetical protein
MPARRLSLPRLNRAGFVISVAALIGALSVLVIVLTLADPPTSMGMLAPTPTYAPVHADTTLTLPLNGNTSPSAMYLTTNFYNATDLDVATAAQASSTGLLQRWSPTMVRLHMGFTGTPPSLPESHYGVFDFTTLDRAIADLRKNHISFFLNVRNGPAWMFDQQGNLRDPSFQEFATYMAQLVGWYNKGGFTDQNGVYHKSGHIGWVHTWEIWNEPNSGYEIPAPVADPAATWMDPVTFARLYSVASTAMRQVDPTIVTGGPALSAYPADDYLQQFITSVTAPLDFLSFHFYAIGDPKTPDPVAFEQIQENFVHRMQFVRRVLDQTFPGKHVPIWVDEVGYNEIARLPVDPRGAAPVGCAWLAATFAAAEYQHATMFSQFPFLGNAQLALINSASRQPFVPYWIYQVLAKEFPVGVLIVPIQSPDGSGIVGAAGIAPDGTSARIVLANTLVAHPTDINGKGIPREVQVNLTAAFRSHAPKANALATVWRFDATTSGASMPATHTLPIFTTSSGALAVQDHMGGYAVDIIQIPLA